MEKCTDPKCPIHGSLKVRGNVLTGTVIAAKADKMVTVKRVLVKKLRKYERYKKILSTVHAHNPKCISAKEGDTVRIGETRKISKTKNFAVLKVIKKVEEKERAKEKVKK